MAEGARYGFEIGEAILDQRQPPAGRIHQIGAARDRLLVAIDADHWQFGGGENGAGIAAGAERAVDVDAAVTRREKLDDGTAEHGNVTSQSASDSP